MGKIFDELGLEATSGMGRVPTHREKDPVAQDDELVRRMAALK